MKYRTRIYYSAAQRAEIWDRWQRGESMSSIGRAFDRESSSVFSVEKHAAFELETGQVMSSMLSVFFKKLHPLCGWS